MRCSTVDSAGRLLGVRVEKLGCRLVVPLTEDVGVMKRRWSQRRFVGPRRRHGKGQHECRQGAQNVAPEHEAWMLPHRERDILRLVLGGRLINGTVPEIL